ncbi:N-glycosylase/DNA lyase [Candidatus Woesearchaeota archaeon]|nr:N-glycosylase/DNA lyase [Candidatus Woesearchaeota archaeon]
MDLHRSYREKKAEIIKRLKGFKLLSEEDLFYELCFCLLTPQSSAKRADWCIQELKKRNFKKNKFDPAPILKQKIRFHNNKGKYLLEMMEKYNELKRELDRINDIKEKRGFLVNSVKGLGLKEAAHYLRNTGHENLAILDRHILKNLVKANVIKELPKTLTKKKYFEIEEKFRKFSEKIKIPMDHLDLLFWSMETGEIFK